ARAGWRHRSSISAKAAGCGAWVATTSGSRRRCASATTRCRCARRTRTSQSSACRASWTACIASPRVRRGSCIIEAIRAHRCVRRGPLAVMRRRFVGFELDLDARELRDGDEIVPLQPQVLALLVYLVEHRERAVPKRELLERLWPDAVVTEASLQRAMSL